MMCPRGSILSTKLLTNGLICAVAGVAFSLIAAPSSALEPRVAAQHVQQAQSDAKAGHFMSAKRRIEWLILTDTDSVARTEVYQRALRQLLLQKPLTFGFSATMLSSSNVSQSSSEDVFRTEIGDFLIGGEEDTSGLGVRLGASATWLHPYALGRDISVNIKASTAYYEDVALRSTTPTLTFSHRWLRGGEQYTFSLFGTQTIYSEIDGRTSPDSAALGMTFKSKHSFSKGRSAALSASWSDRSYEEQTYLDGTTASLRASYSLPVNERGKVTITGGWTSASLAAEHFSYSGPVLGLGYGRQTSSGLAWSVNFSKTWRDYDDIFTALTYARHDEVDTLSVSLSHREIKIKGMTPRLTCASKQQNSNVALYTYDSFDCFVSLNHAF